MIDIIEVDENNRGLSANCNYGSGQNTIEFEFESEDVRQKVFANIRDYIFKDTQLTYDPLPKEEPKTMDDVIKENLKNMILAVIPDGETITKENEPTLVDIINPSAGEESGTQANPIVIVDNDIAHNGYLYTYGKYYKWNNVVYQCKRTGESDGGTIKLYYTPDQLIGHYFVTV